MKYLKSINLSLHDLMETNNNVVLIGEDLHDPYGGAFKVSQGLSTKYPGRVISTPISEAGISGSAVGMAIRGIKPIIEIMFGDFILLTMDQIVNHATKYKWMFNDKVSVPIIIRAPMGGGRGYGPTHSQSLESMFLSVPGLSIYAPSIFNNPGQMLAAIVQESDDPVLFIENKTSYPKELILSDEYKDFKISRYQSGSIEEIIYFSIFPEEKDDVLIFTYGGMSEIALEAANQAFIEEEIICSVVVCNSLKPISKKIIDLAKEANKTIILEEGNKVGGWGSELSCMIIENTFNNMKSHPIRIGSEDQPIACTLALESETLPSYDKVLNAIIDCMN